MAEEGEWEKGGGVVRERGKGQWVGGGERTSNAIAQDTFFKREGEGEGEEAVARQREGEDETAA